MEEYDLYINERKPSIGLCVRKGAGLPDLADIEDWVFDGTAAQDLLPHSVVQDVRANGHAFRALTQQLRKLGDIRRHPSCFVLCETAHDPAPGRFVFEVDKRDVLFVGRADLETLFVLDDLPGCGQAARFGQG